jgi:hypothetical protein
MRRDTGFMKTRKRIVIYDCLRGDGFTLTYTKKGGCQRLDADFIVEGFSICYLDKRKVLIFISRVLKKPYLKRNLSIIVDARSNTFL